MKFIVAILVCIATIRSNSQDYNSNNEIWGSVKLQNSQNERLSEVKISPYFGGANPSYSNRQGKFSLKFPTKAVGDRIVIDVEKDGYEWINKESTSTVIIPKNRDDYELIIVMNKMGALKNQANEIYNKRLKNLEAAYAKRFTELESKYARDTTNLTAELRKLKEEFEAQKERSQEQALRLAQIDLDQSEMYYRKAYNYFSKGDVDSALVVLDDGKIESIFEKTTNLKRILNNHIKEAIQVFKLKAEAHLQKLEYEKAIEAYKKVTYLLDEPEANLNGINPYEEYHFIGQLYRDIADYDSSYSFQEKAISWLIKTVDPGHPELEKANKLLTSLSKLKREQNYYQGPISNTSLPPLIPIQPTEEGKIKVAYDLQSAGRLEMILMTSELREVSRVNFDSETAGTAQKVLDISRAPNGQYILILKADDDIIGRYSINKH